MSIRPLITGCICRNRCMLFDMQKGCPNIEGGRQLFMSNRAVLWSIWSVRLEPLLFRKMISLRGLARCCQAVSFDGIRIRP